MLAAEDLLICDLERPVAIAGVMGGADAEVSDATTRRPARERDLHAAPACCARARRLGLHTEASHRFERGIDPEGADRAAARVLRADRRLERRPGPAGRGRGRRGRPSGGGCRSARPGVGAARLRGDVRRRRGRVRDPPHDRPRRRSGPLEVEIPGYRVDIEREVDLIEEVARIQGYDRIESTLPTVRQAGGMPPAYAFVRRLRDALVRAGLHEARLLSFASQEDLDLMGDTDAIGLTNPLQADEAALRTSLAPGLLHAAAAQPRPRRALGGALRDRHRFRIGRPRRGTLARGGRAARHRRRGLGRRPAAPRRARRERRRRGAAWPSSGSTTWSLGDPPGRPLHPGRSATVLVGGEPSAWWGRCTPASTEALELEGRVALLRARRAGALGGRRDGRLRARRRPSAAAGPPRSGVHRARGRAGRRRAGGPRGRRRRPARSSLLFDVHRGDPLPAGTKSLAFAVEFRAPDRTLTGEEADRAVAAIAERLPSTSAPTLRAG